VEPALNPNSQNLKAQIENLVRLQSLDLEILQRRNQAKKLEADIKEAELAASEQRRQLEAQQQQTETLLKDRREAERTVKERQEQISKLQGQIYDVKTNDAYNALQAEVKQKKQEVALLEERILEMMMSEDEYKKGTASAQLALKAAEGAIAVDQAKIRQAMTELEAQIAELQAQWKAAASSVQAEYLDRYVRLRDAKGGLAMSKIENDICQGCRLSIRPQASIELQKYRALLYCDNCARILYVE
jgi:predicted  nucleic acid-binding Zn-ribbon protein